MNFNNDTSIYIQIMEYIKTNIISGLYKPGDKLPSVRDFSIMMKVNPNTMQKALNELEELKLIETERTNGKYVTKNVKLIENYRNEIAIEKTNIYLKCMKSIGLTNEEIFNLIGGKK